MKIINLHQNDKGLWIFAVEFSTPHGPITIRGWRYDPEARTIHRPAIRMKNNWYTVIYMPTGVWNKLYELVEEELKNMLG